MKQRLAAIFVGTALCVGALLVRGGEAAQGRTGGLPPCTTIACDIQADWVANNVLLAGLAQAMPEDKYGFKPTSPQQTFGERVMHVVTVNMALLNMLGAKTPPPAINQKASSKADILAALQRTTEYGGAVLKEFNEQQLAERVTAIPFMGPTASRQRLIYFMMSHSQDTYGQLVVYLRLNGGTPPASQQP
jgi:uncharacterized damage-inducible protein DinB